MCTGPQKRRFRLFLVVTTVFLLVPCGIPAVSGAASSGSLSITTTGLSPRTRPLILVAGRGTRRAIRAQHVTLRGLPPGRYLLLVKATVIPREAHTVRAGATAYPVKRRLLAVVGAGKITKVTAAYGAVLNPGVRPAPQHIIDVRGSAENPTAIIVGGGSPVPPVDSIITSGPSSKLPSGLLAKVTATKHQGAKVVITLAAAAVSEAAPQLSYTGSLQLKPAPGAGEQSGSSIPAQTASVRNARPASAC